MYNLNELAFGAMLEQAKQSFNGNPIMKLAVDKLSYEYNRAQYNDCLQHIDAFFDYIMNEAGTKGLKMPRGNKNGIIKYAIALPSMEEQKRIVEEISNLDTLIENAKSVMNSCSMRKKSVIERYL